MFLKTVGFLYLCVVASFAIDTQQRDCSGQELGPALDFQASVDQKLHLSWRPPQDFETCDIEYQLHIQNLNTSEYLTPAKTLTDLSYSFDYAEYDQLCVYVRATLIPNYDDNVGTPAYAHSFTVPLTEVGPPTGLTILNSVESLKMEWSTPEGYEKCYPYFMFSVSIILKDGTRVFGANVAGYATSYYYTQDNPLHCNEADLEIKSYFKGSAGESITKTIMFGPEGVCK